MKGPAQVGVDLPWEVVQAQTPLKNGSLVKQLPGREAVQNKSRKRKMRNLALSFRSLNDTLEAVVGRGLGLPEARHGNRGVTLYHVSRWIYSFIKGSLPQSLDQQIVVAQSNVRKDSAGKTGQGRISRISRMNTGKGCVVQLRGGTFSDVEI